MQWLCEVYAADGATVARVTDRGVVYVATHGLAAPLRGQHCVRDSMTYRAVSLGNTQRYEQGDGSIPAPTHARARRLGVASGLVTPVCIRGRTHATIGVVSGRPRAFDGGDAAMLEDIAAMLTLIFERHALERQLELMDGLMTLGHVAGHLAHEAKRPVQVVTTSLERLRQRLEQSCPDIAQAGAPLFEEAHAAVASLKRLFDAVHHFLRRETDPPAFVIDPRTEIRQAVQLTRGYVEAVGQFEIVVPERLPAVEVPPGRIVQILVNLLVNAADAVGAVHAPEHAHRVTLRAGADSNELRMVVEDTGVGIPAHLVDRIFEPFFSTKRSKTGLGLGLALVRAYVHQIGGGLEVQSTPGEGTVIAVTVPLPCAAGGTGAEMARS